MTRTVILVNPTAGGGRGARRWQRLQAAVPQVNEAHCIEAQDAEESRQQLTATLDRGDVERVIAIGGDGTAHLVANVLLQRAVAERPAFGLVPAGTGSDLARGLGLPRRPAAALHHALGAPPRPLDVLFVRTEDGRERHVLNIGSGGLSGAVVMAISANPKRGPLSYMLSTLKGLATYRPAACRVIADGEDVYAGPLFLVAMANSRFFGKGMKVAPQAVPYDGWLDLIVVPPVPRWQLPFRLPLFLTGGHVRMKQVITRKVEQVRLEPGPGFPPFELDGEIFDAAAAEIRVVAGALRVVV